MLAQDSFPGLGLDEYLLELELFCNRKCLSAYTAVFRTGPEARAQTNKRFMIGLYLAHTVCDVKMAHSKGGGGGGGGGGVTCIILLKIASGYATPVK